MTLVTLLVIGHLMITVLTIKWAFILMILLATAIWIGMRFFAASKFFRCSDPDDPNDDIDPDDNHP